MGVLTQRRTTGNAPRNVGCSRRVRAGEAGQLAIPALAQQTHPEPFGKSDLFKPTGVNYAAAELAA